MVANSFEILWFDPGEIEKKNEKKKKKKKKPREKYLKMQLSFKWNMYFYEPCINAFTLQTGPNSVTLKECQTFNKKTRNVLWNIKLNKMWDA